MSAIVATAHKIAEIFYVMVKNKIEYNENKVGLSEEELLRRKIERAQRTLNILNEKLYGTAVQDFVIQKECRQASEAEGVQRTHATAFSNSYPLRVLAFGEVACVHYAIANKFALNSLTRNIPLAQEEEYFKRE